MADEFRLYIYPCDSAQSLVLEQDKIEATHRLPQLQLLCEHRLGLELATCASNAPRSGAMSYEREFDCHLPTRYRKRHTVLNLSACTSANVLRVGFSNRLESCLVESAVCALLNAVD